MIFDVITIFPEMIDHYFQSGVLKKAVGRDLISVRTHNLRDYSRNRWKRVDEPVAGHGKGMLLTPEPLKRAVCSLRGKSSGACRTVYLSPRGRLFNHRMARKLSEEEHLILISARYEGMDERFVEKYVDEEISIGDYVLTGGELPALILIDAVSRFISGTIEKESADEDSFENGLLEYGQYTEPDVFEGMKIPEILKSGHRQKIDDFRFQDALRKTLENRPDLLVDYRWPEKKSSTGNPLKQWKQRNQNISRFLKTVEKLSEEMNDG